MANWQWGDGEREKVNPEIGILVQADSELGRRRSYFQVLNSNQFRRLTVNAIDPPKVTPS
jgi:hypothetical protein